ncbi:MAG: ROK family protein, partial [Acidobacteria bacterium]|nr:ROK family protein [Acidobacteriota bacterium]
MTLRPPLDPGFRPIVLDWRAYLERARTAGDALLRIAVEREDGLVSAFVTRVPEKDAEPAATYLIVERLVKFLLWSRGGWRVHFLGPAVIGKRLKADYSEKGARAFDVRTMSRVYERPFEVVLPSPATFPEVREAVHFPGGHLDGCRIGFDLGASDYKVAAVVDGEPVYSEEIPWTPGEQADPDYHYRHIQEGLKKAAAHLPRVDAIGGSSAGILIRNQVRIASLFRSVPGDLFEKKVKDIFVRLAAEWGVPFEVINDGEVTALAGMLSLGETGVLGMA